METIIAREGPPAKHGIDTTHALLCIHKDPLFEAPFKTAGVVGTVHGAHKQGAASMARRAGPACIEVSVGTFPSPWEFIQIPKVPGI